MVNSKEELWFYKGYKAAIEYIMETAKIELDKLKDILDEKTS